jgi:hypothetical protein
MPTGKVRVALPQALVAPTPDSNRSSCRTRSANGPAAL